MITDIENEISATEHGIQYVSMHVNRIDESEERVLTKKGTGGFPSARYRILSFIEDEANSEGWIKKDGGNGGLIPWMSEEMVVEGGSITRRIYQLKEEKLIIFVHDKAKDYGALIGTKLTDRGKEVLGELRQKYPKAIEELEMKKDGEIFEEGEVDIRKITGKRLDRQFECMRSEIVHMSNLLGKEFDDFMDVFHEFKENEPELKQEIIGEMAWEIRELAAEIDKRSTLHRDIDNLDLAA